MRERLTYFMWGFQQHFRAGLQMEMERVLEEIGLPVKPRALLVGFAAAENAVWPVCVEPEYRFFQPAHLDGALERAREMYENDPNFTTLHSDRRMHELYHRSLRDSCRAAAVVEALNRHAPEPVTYFAGHSTQVGDYEVHPVIGLPTDVLEIGRGTGSSSSARSAEQSWPCSPRHAAHCATSKFTPGSANS